MEDRYVRQLCSFNEFVMIQEHWFVESQLSLFDREIKNISSHCISGIDNTRPVPDDLYRGCGSLWKSDIPCEVTPLPNDCKNLCAVSVNIKSSKFLICTVGVTVAEWQHSCLPPLRPGFDPRDGLKWESW